MPRKATSAPPADERDLQAGVGGQLGRDGRARGDDLRLQVGAQAPGQLERRRAAVEHDHLPVAHVLRRPPRDARLGRGRPLGPLRERAVVAASGERTAMDPPQQPGLVELAQVAADGVR
jgi:hypothetical protein